MVRSTSRSFARRVVWLVARSTPMAPPPTGSSARMIATRTVTLSRALTKILAVSRGGTGSACGKHRLADLDDRRLAGAQLGRSGAAGLRRRHPAAPGGGAAGPLLGVHRRVGGAEEGLAGSSVDRVM